MIISKYVENIWIFKNCIQSQLFFNEIFMEKSGIVLVQQNNNYQKMLSCFLYCMFILKVRLENVDCIKINV